jgi:DNA-binding SARP family transcriptional activator
MQGVCNSSTPAPIVDELQTGSDRVVVVSAPPPDVQPSDGDGWSADGDGRVTIDFRVLGPIEARRDGVPLTLGGPQQRRMLATLLAESGRAVPVERLVDAVWPDDPPDGSRRTVMTYVSRLRSVLGEGWIRTEGSGYRLEVEASALDASRFERLVDRARRTPPTQTVALIEEALALWRGDAYGEFATEWWALPHAARLEELHVVAVEHRAEALLAIGDHGRAISDLERLVLTYPLRGRFAEQLVRAYAAAGREAEALRAVQAHREHLAEHTGLTPPESLLQLERSILGGTPTPVASGRPLRGYLLGEVIGEGGFGTVYRSVQPGVDREVAVKVIRSELADAPEFVRRFELEAQLVARLEHPHVVPLYDFWREPGGAYLVFRLLRGGSIEDTLRDGPWSLERATRLLDEIGGALGHAHAHGVLHRDVKPANVLFDEAGNSYLADFGIAVGGSVTSPVGDVNPSPRYSPPEHLECLDGSPASDQYSLAAIVWEILAGVPAFDDETPSELVDRQRHGPVPSLADIRPDLPAAADAVLQRATASRAADRFPDVAAFVAAWRRATAGHRPAAEAAEAATAAWSGSDTAPNPFVGLRAFGEADAARFFGRDALADHLADLVCSSALVAIVGASGSGKSSLVNAGLVPRLRRAGERVATMVPGDDPDAQLRLALLSVATREPQCGDPAEAIRAVAGHGPGALTVVVDQFEELWTLSSEPARDRFLAGLARLAEPGAGGGRVRVVVVVRADFYDRPLADPVLGRHIAAHTFPVTPMTTAELHEAVTGPAAAIGASLEAGLAAEIVAEVLAHRAGLPLLQFTLADLYERRDVLDVMTRAAYRSLGGISGALAERAEQLYAELSDDDQVVARRLLLRLVVPGDGADDTRRRLRHSELPAHGAAVAGRLQAQRLLVADRDPASREPTVEIAHESLLHAWPRLGQWLDDDRQIRRQLQHLDAAARSWDGAGRADAELYRGDRLETAGELARTRRDDLGALEVEFVVASQQAAARVVARDRAQRRRLQRTLALTAVALVLALVAGALAVVARGDADARADEADVARLVSLSQSLASSKRDVAALLALAASERDPGPATDGALLAAVYTDPSFVADVRPGGSGGHVEFSPDGNALYSLPVALGEPVLRYDLETDAVTELPLGQGDLAVHPFLPVDDRHAVLALGEPDNPEPLIRLVDVDTGAIVATAELSAPPYHLALSPSGERLAVTTYGTTTRAATVDIFDLPSLDAVGSVAQPGPNFPGVGSGAQWPLPSTTRGGRRRRGSTTTVWPWAAHPGACSCGNPPPARSSSGSTTGQCASPTSPTSPTCCGSPTTDLY